MTRINRVLEHMAKLQVDSVIIKDVTTIRYLTGLQEIPVCCIWTDNRRADYGWPLYRAGQKRNEVLQGVGVYSDRCAQHLLPPQIWQRMPKRR